MIEMFRTKSAEETILLGEKLGRKLKGGDVVCLTGDLGGGKTHFTKGIAKGLNIEELVVSPTFIVMRIYERNNLPDLYHLDLYRMNSVKDLDGMDLEDIIGNPEAIVVIEWPERAKEIVPENAIWVKFAYVDDQIRKIEIEQIDKT